MRSLKQYASLILALIFLGAGSGGLADQKATRTLWPFASVTRQGGDIVATLDQEAGDYILPGVPGQHSAGPGNSIVIKSASHVELSTHMGSFVVNITTRHNHLGLLVVNTYRTSSMSGEYHVERSFIRAK